MLFRGRQGKDSQVKIHYIESDLIRVMELCDKNNIYAYDAFFLDCAIRFKAPLLSLDRKLKSIAKDLQITVLEV